MSQFTLYANIDRDSKETYPYFVDVQSNLLSNLDTRVVIPLTANTSVNRKVAQTLCPIINLDDTEYVILTNQITVLPNSSLELDIISLDYCQQQIVDAIAMLTAVS